jgi:hypothetical protein
MNLSHQKFISFLLTISLSFIVLEARAGLRVTEIMQSNIDCVMLENDFPDSWVEIYNDSNEGINLHGFYLGPDKGDFSTAYRFYTDTIIAPKEFIVIPCDKEGVGLRTNFRLESGKGGVYLYDARLNYVDGVSFKKMPAPNVSYGLTALDSDEWAYYVKATPGRENQGVVSTNLLLNAIFSRDGGVFYDAVALTVSMPDEVLPDDVRLCVSLDGREPMLSDSVSAPFSIEIEESTSVKAKLISAKWLNNVSTCRSFIFPGRQLDLPVVSITTSPDYLYDETIGILMGDESQSTPNYARDWRRPVHVAYYDGENHDQVINQLAEVSVQGGASRKFPQKSLNLYANKRFGEKRFAYPFWKDKPNVTAVKSFILRNSGSDFKSTHISDAYLQTLFGRHIDSLDWQAYQPVIAYINGEYYGLIDVRERSNDHYIEANYDGLEDIAMVESWWESKTDGSLPYFNDFVSVYQNPNCTFEELSEIMDIDNFINLTLANSFGFNLDTPGWNIIQWTPLDKISWRWIFKDFDIIGFTDYTEKSYIDYLEREITGDWFGNTEKGTELFRKCLSFPQFRSRLVDLFVAYYGDFLNSDVSLPLLDNMVEEIADERQLLAEKYELKDQSYFEALIGDFRRFIKKRSVFLVTDFQEQFELGAPIKMMIDNTVSDIEVNGHRIKNPEFNGVVYADKPVSLITEPGYVWQVEAESVDGNVEVYESREERFSFRPTDNMAAYRLKPTLVTGIALTWSSDNIGVSASGEYIRVICQCKGEAKIAIHDIAGKTILSSTVKSGESSFRISQKHS